ncbi:MAG: hypothetical protein V3U76_20015 [Granulosicoccus sp.]
MNSVILTATAFLFSSSVAFAALTVTGNTISWPDDGWYQVQSVNEDGIFEVCAGGSSCEVTQGTYIVINHTTGQRFADVQVSGLAGNNVVVTGNMISWPADGWYQVQRADDYSEVCSGTAFCEVEPGIYNVINHTTMQRFDAIEVTGNSGVDAVSVEGNVIRWPDNGWYQVQNAATFESMCEGSTSCRVPAGNYIVINHTSGDRTENVLVSDVVDIADAIQDKIWRLIAVQEDTGNLTPVFQESDFEFTIRLSSSTISPGADVSQPVTSVGGVNVCNNYAGGYSLESNILNLIAVSEEDSSCERAGELPAIIFTSVLFSSDKPPILSVENDELTMTSGNNEALVFRNTDVDANVLSAPDDGVTVYFRVEDIPASEFISTNGAPYYDGKRYTGVLGWGSVEGADGYDIYLNDTFIASSAGNSDNGGYSIAWSYAPGQGQVGKNQFVFFTAIDFKYQLVAWNDAGQRSVKSLVANFVESPDHPSLLGR